MFSHVQLCSGLLSLSSGKIGLCSRPEIKMELARKLFYIEFIDI
jgi:hypothetical protein